VLQEVDKAREDLKVVMWLRERTLKEGVVCRAQGKPHAERTPWRGGREHHLLTSNYNHHLLALQLLSSSYYFPLTLSAIFLKGRRTRSLGQVNP